MREAWLSLATPWDPHQYFPQVAFLLPENVGGIDWECPEFLMMHEVQKGLLGGKGRVQRFFAGFLRGMTAERPIRSWCILRAGFLMRILPIGTPATPVTQSLSLQVTLPIPSPLFASRLDTSPSFCSSTACGDPGGSCSTLGFCPCNWIVSPSKS